jgi:hypothetical protein
VDALDAALAHKIAFAKFQKGQAANAEAQARVTLHQFQASLVFMDIPALLYDWFR